MRDPQMSPPAAKPETPSTSAEPEPNLRQWLARNGPILVPLGALLVYLFIQFDSDGLWAIAKAALGLSFVVFFHELGHFLVAKWCDVHVTTFSIGFGPAIPGCSFQRGETTYKLALFPLGGYVQMVGQVDGDESSDGNEDDPRSYRNKSVGQRMAIISAGVVMNVILAVICFIVVFRGPGKDRRAPVVESTEAGSPAFVTGVRTSDQILRIGDVKNPSFEGVTYEVLATVAGEELRMDLKRPQDPQARTIEIEPRVSRDSKRPQRPMLGIAPALCLTLESRRAVPRTMDRPVFLEGAAKDADPPFEFGDRIIATTDPDNPAQVKDLPLDPRKPNSDQRDYFEFERRLTRLASRSVVMRVERTGPDGKKSNVDISVPAAFHKTFGARMQIGDIVSLRRGSTAEAALVQVRTGTLEGDRILGVKIQEPDGSWTAWGDIGPLPKGASIAWSSFTDKNPIDPMRLPFQLKQWANRFYEKKPKDAPADVILHIRRHNKQSGPDYREIDLKVAWDYSWRFDRVSTFDSTDPQAIPELGLAYQVKTTVAHVEPAFAGNADGLQKNDVIKEIRLAYSEADGTTKQANWVELSETEYPWVFTTFQLPIYVHTISVKVERTIDGAKETKEIEIVAQDDKTWPLENRGLILAPDVRRQKADSLVQAIALGMQDTHNSMMQVYQNLRGMILGRISVKNLGGPVMIAQVAYRIAGYDFWEFVFFMGLISVNLAVINFLPIPVLDGGHMVFLLYEKLRGKPASEGVRVGATYAGLALILSLMVFVLYQDISRLFH
jgi:regulator of sigma E protease